jgi:hypothetical protein
MLGGSSGINYMVYVRGHSMSEVALSMGPDALRALRAAARRSCRRCDALA